MDMTVVGTRQAFDQALRAARIAATKDNSEALQSITDGALLGRLEEVWGDIESAFRVAFQWGRDAARDSLSAAITKAEALLESAGNKAKEIHEGLLIRLQQFTRVFIEGALSRVPTSLVVGELKYGLKSVKCTQKLIVTGSLKITLTDVFSLVSTGEFEIAVDYVLPGQ